MAKKRASEGPTAADIVIVGGGLAGLAAAEALSRTRPDLKLLLLESKRLCGGRAGSYRDPETAQEVDYCQHAAMGCCTNFLDLIERCGLGECFERIDELTFLHPKAAPSRFAASPILPPPLHLLGTINAQRYLSRTQRREIKRGLWKLMRTIPDELRSCSAGQWLSGAGQSESTQRDFWDVILVSALGEHSRHVSMAAARKVIIDGFAAARGASDVLIPKSSLAELFGRRLTEHL
ncbi:MAG: NAD(P)-binding protein, partial [Planctomycetota bacterium]